MSKRITEKDKEFAIYLYQEKRMDAHQVAKAIGIGKTSVYNILKDAGIPTHKPTVSEANRRRHAEPEVVVDEVKSKTPDNTAMVMLRIIENQERIIELLTELNERWK